MTSYAAFLRAINVGGHTVKMDRLRGVFEELELDDVRTVINSGNVLFSTDGSDEAALERRIEEALAAELGYEVASFVRSAAEVVTVAGRDPFPRAPEEELVQVGFLKTEPSAVVRADVEALAGAKDEIVVAGREIHWHVRGRTMDSLVKPRALAKAIGGETTLRNVNTVRKIAGLLAQE